MSGTAPRGWTSGRRRRASQRFRPLTEFELTREQVIRCPLAETFAFFADPWNLEAITPHWLRFRILDAPANLHAGALLLYRLRLFGAPISWLTEISEWNPPHAFTDIQLEGPYRLWLHAHAFTPVTAGTRIHDHVRYCVPGGPLASGIERTLVRRWLDRIFDHRAERLSALLESEATLR